MKSSNASRHPKRSILALPVIAGLLLTLFALSPYAPGEIEHRQANAAANSVWGAPVNLSRTGAAGDPRVFAGSDGLLQVFWVDRFDGLMTALFNGEAWSLPAPSQMLPPPNRLGVSPTPLKNLPEMFLEDANGLLHAFYRGEPNEDKQSAPLVHSNLKVGEINWKNGVEVSSAVGAFTAIPASDLELKLFYLRTLKGDPAKTPLETEPGLYMRSTSSKTIAWNAPQMLETSPYYRVIEGEQVTLQAANAGPVILLVWSEPRLGQLVTALSPDLGKTWTDEQPLDLPGQPTGVLLASLPGSQALRIWQDSSQPGCVLYQQTYSLNTSGDAAAPGAWDAPQRVQEQIANCPQNSRFIAGQGKLYWIWGEATNEIYISVWDTEEGAAAATWSLPQRFTFSFEDPETGRSVQLEDLHLALSGDQIAVAGFDRASGDVWSLTTLASALELIYAPPLPWTFPQEASNAASGQQASHPAIASDPSTTGSVHLVWNQGAALPGNSIFYSRFDERGLIKPVEVVRAAEGEIADQPAILVGEDDLLHMLWVGGSDGQLAYSRARLREASSPGGWLPAAILAERGPVSWPQIAGDAAGRLFVLYVVRVNEGRGVYLLSSSNKGDSWSEPALVFDAAAAGWEIVDHPSLLITPDGNLHIAFVRGNLSGAPSMVIHYMRTLSPTPLGSNPQQMEWIEPVTLAENGADWPSLAFVGEQLHLLYISPTGLGQRWLQLSEQAPDGLGWKSASLVPDWSELGAALFKAANAASAAAQQPPYKLVADAQTLHLIAPLPDAQSLQYGVWFIPQDNASGGAWNTEELYSPLGNWQNLTGVAAAAPLTGGRLAVAWMAKPQAAGPGTPTPSLSSIYLSLRSIPQAAVQATQVTLPSVTPTLIPTDIPTQTPQPTATLAPDLPPTPTEAGLSPFVLGGGLAAFIVILIFAGILMRGRR